MLHMQVSKAKHEANIFLENREQAIVASKIQQNRENRERKRRENDPESAGAPSQQEESKTETTSQTTSKDAPKDEILDDDFMFRLVGQAQGENDKAGTPKKNKAGTPKKDKGTPKKEGAGTPKQNKRKRDTQ
eukprot:TRINITY_DN1865_c0_g1_i1.p2 TRINITY_DN1865_c0_g1~~TRINITY_DN1865_c0_g1_i1.p2  ORF type:complete len:132 (-),score=49.43 TRINITY_DN1865_c0_g1_i1:25-420(-)